jgi:1-acyl-sn-glycerol-3-phosphate acyltransferase
VTGAFAGAVRAVVFVALTLPLMPVQALFILCWPAKAKKFPHLYHRLLGRLLGFNIVVEGTLPRTGSCLIVANHVSWIDIVVLSMVTPLSFVAKREVATWPLFGWMAKLQRTVFIDRERRQSTKHSRNTLEQRLTAGDVLVLFPEGTSHDGATLLPFKSAFFAAAAAPDHAIVPVTLAYTRHWNLPLTRRMRPRFAWYADMDMLPHLWGALCAGPLTVNIIIHPHLEAEIGRDRKRASQASHQIIRRSLAAALHGRSILE